MQTLRQVLDNALALPPIERAELIEELFLSFDRSGSKRIDQLWAVEAESRIDAFERGEFASIPADEVFRYPDSWQSNLIKED